MMRVIAAFASLLLLAGCVSDGLTPDQLAAVQASNTQNLALARAHKITYAEAAGRANAAAARASGGQLSEEQGLINAYRAAVYSQVDAGQMTPEVAEYAVQEKAASIAKANRARRAAAAAAFADGMAKAGDDARQQLQNQQMINAMNRPVNCTSTAFLNTVNTHCQ